MTTTFQDNQAVTLADLNNIAVDLGDTTFSAFSEEKFGVDKLNQITADLVTAGILRTEDGGDLGLKIGCTPTYLNGIITIWPGTIVFANGAKTYIEKPIELEVVAGSYIYALNDVLTGKASLQASDTEPTEGDFVMLASISAEGSLIDKRNVAKSKVLSTTDGTLRTFSVDVDSASKNSIDIEGDFSYIIGWSVRGKLPYGQNAFPISDGDSVTISFWDSVKGVVERDGNTLKCSTHTTGSGSFSSGIFKFSVI